MLFVLTLMPCARACCSMCGAGPSYETVAIAAMERSGGTNASAVDETYEMTGDVVVESEDDVAYEVVATALGASFGVREADPEADPTDNAHQPAVAEDAEYEYAGAGLIDANTGSSTAAGFGVRMGLNQPTVSGSRDYSSVVYGDGGGVDTAGLYSGYEPGPTHEGGVTDRVADDGEYLEVGIATFVKGGFAIPRAPEKGYVNEDVVARALANAPGVSTTFAESTLESHHVAGAVAASKKGVTF